MKVKELIEELKKYNQELEVMIDETDEWSAFHGIDFVEMIKLDSSDEIVSIRPDRDVSTEDL